MLRELKFISEFFLFSISTTAEHTLNPSFVLSGFQEQEIIASEDIISPLLSAIFLLSTIDSEIEAEGPSAKARQATKVIKIQRITIKIKLILPAFFKWAFRNIFLGF